MHVLMASLRDGDRLSRESQLALVLLPIEVALLGLLPSVLVDQRLTTQVNHRT